MTRAILHVVARRRHTAAEGATHTAQRAPAGAILDPWGATRALRGWRRGTRSALRPQSLQRRRDGGIVQHIRLQPLHVAPQRLRLGVHGGLQSRGSTCLLHERSIAVAEHAVDVTGSGASIHAQHPREVRCAPRHAEVVAVHRPGVVVEGMERVDGRQLPCTHRRRRVPRHEHDRRGVRRRQHLATNRLRATRMGGLPPAGWARRLRAVGICVDATPLGPRGCGPWRRRGAAGGQRGTYSTTAAATAVATHPRAAAHGWSQRVHGRSP